MNLDKLFQMQKALDERINKEHGLEGQDLLPKKILALQVELGELANEWRGFKFWSKDQEPRNFEWFGICEKCNGHGNDDENISCPNCAGTGDGYRNPLLEEYVDCIHFILSIGNELNLKDDLILEDISYKFTSILEVFSHIYNWSTGLDYLSQKSKNSAKKPYKRLFETFLKLGEMLGFTWEQIEQAYIEKNAVNHTRQSEGY